MKTAVWVSRMPRGVRRLRAWRCAGGWFIPVTRAAPRTWSVLVLRRHDQLGHPAEVFSGRGLARGLRAGALGLFVLEAVIGGWRAGPFVRAMIRLPENATVRGRTVPGSVPTWVTGPPLRGHLILL